MSRLPPMPDHPTADCWTDAESSCIRAYARAAVQAAQPEAVGAALPTVCDGKEQEAFEAFCVREKMILSIHPIHYLFLDPKTDAARQAWKAALNYVGSALASAPTPEPMSAPTAEPSDADWADFGAWAERDKGAMDLLEKLIDVWDDGQLPHEHRCYVDGAWAELIAEARAAIRATKGGKL